MSNDHIMENKIWTSGAPTPLLVRRAIIRLHKRYVNSRFHMMILLGFSGVAGFFVSTILLYSGINLMAVRYPLSIAAAYGVFLLGLKLWIFYTRLNDDYNEKINNATIEKECADDGEDEIDLKAIFAADAQEDDDYKEVEIPNSLAFSNLYTEIEDEFNNDQNDFGISRFKLVINNIVIFIAVVLILLSLLLCSVYFVYIAPDFLGALLADTMSASFIYSNTKEPQKDIWFKTAVRKSWWMFLITAALLGIIGGTVQYYYPLIINFSDMLGRA